MYADYKYYTDTYLAGRDPVIVKETDFNFFERSAEKEVNNRTYGRIQKRPDLITDDVKNCVCALTEFLFKCDTLDESSFQNGGGRLVSYSNDGDSGSFDLSQSDFVSDQARQKKISGLVSFYLSGTGLLYRGVC
ncbi:hypothetical protein [Massilistercora timonensis]|uniref:hypothetical protein n=1 Tax=Massilistercora timonensis TaxID=2086584 RepID=UPI003AB582E5